MYVGMTEPADEYIVKGIRMHGRALRSTRNTHRNGGVSATNVLDWTRKVIDPRAKIIVGSAKHRYLLPLDAEMRARIAPLAKPYPKRVKQATDEHPLSGGGAAPTHTLQPLAERAAQPAEAA
jgi:hypothetical protein